MKQSIYNCFVTDENGQVIAYNTLSKSLLKIYKEKWSIVQDILKDVNQLPDAEEAKGYYDILKKQNFIISDDLDEIKAVEFRYNQSLFNGDHLLLNIVPTMNCNFDCKYCFEHKTNRRMTKETLFALEKWIKNQMKYKTTVQVGWFGGEPLLCKEHVIYLNESIKKMADDMRRNFYSSITTNGYLLDKEFANKIIDLGITNAQITVDGDENGHNHYRPLAGGKGSFKKIIENIEYLANVVNTNKQANFNISLRVNVGDKNYHGIEKLLDTYSEIVKQNSTIYFRWIWSSQEKGNENFVNNWSQSEKLKKLDELYQKASEKGFKTSNPFTEVRYHYCEVDNINHYYVSPEGGFYVCSESYKPEEAIAFIKDDGNLDIKPEKLLKWYTKNAFSDEECLKCKLLPMCFGGCRKSRNQYNGRPCINEKNDINCMVKAIFREKTSSNFQKRCPVINNPTNVVNQ